MTLIYNGHEFNVDETDYSLTVDGSAKPSDTNRYQVSVTNDKTPQVLGITDTKTGTFFDLNGETMSVTNVDLI